jgi:transposase-like protein
MNLIDVTKVFATDEACIAHLESMRWPNGIACPECGGKNISKIARKPKEKKKGKHVNMRSRIYQCLKCQNQFSATSGTLFHDSHLPLSKWFIAIALITNAKKGISAMQLKRDLGVSYKTAWYLYHRIRKAMEEENETKLTGIVEADETFVGGRYDKRRKRDAYDKPCVVGVIQRGWPSAGREDYLSRREGNLRFRESKCGFRSEANDRRVCWLQKVSEDLRSWDSFPLETRICPWNQSHQFD